MSVSLKGHYTLTGQIKISDGVSTPLATPPTGTLLWTLNNPTPVASDNFGWSVSISGNRAIVGAFTDDTGASGAGSAYIYDITTGALLKTLNNPTPADNDFFGRAVAIDGNYAIVGAPAADDAGAVNAGSAYIYDVTTGALLRTLNNPTPAQSDNFGYSVAIDGNYAIVGTPNDNTGASAAGSAYIYDVTTGALLRTLNNPTPESFDAFGTSVSISGNYAIVGAYNDDTGASDAGSAYIYDVTTGALLRTLNKTSPVGGDYFGYSVSISGNYAIVGAYGDDTGASGAGSAYIYDVTTGALLWTINNPTPAFGDNFGYSVAIDGNYAIVSAYRDDTGATDTGSAYIFDVTTGALLRTINNPTPALSDRFGNSVSISGNYAIVGANRDNTGATDTGSAYIYN